MIATAPAPDAAPPRPRRSRGVLWTGIAIGVAFILGAAVLLYPAAATWFTQVQQSNEVEALSQDVNAVGPTERERELQRARDYNASLSGGATVAANERIPLAEGGTGAVGGDDYFDLLQPKPSGPMARIKIPAIQLDLPIYHGTTDDVLQRGVGHLQGTALPVGGAGTHSVLTGHRGLAGAELFTRLDEVRIGDTFTIEVFGEVLTYQVRTTEVVAPEDTETLYPTQGRDLVTLVTCTPLGINSHRILVTGERILPTPPDDIASAGDVPDVPGFPWWAVGMGGAVMAAAAYVGWSIRASRNPGKPQSD